MRIKFEYPMATEENMKAVQDAINAGMDNCDLCEAFGEEMVWDCIAVLSGNKDTTWALLDHMDGNRQTGTEDWQSEICDDYIAKSQTLFSKKTPQNGIAYAIGIIDKVLIVYAREDMSLKDEKDTEWCWDYHLLNRDGAVIDEGEILGGEETPLGEIIVGVLKEYNLSTDCNWELCDFTYYHCLEYEE